MVLRRTTVVAEGDDLALLAREAKERHIPLGRLLGELVADRASRLRQGRRPRVAMFRSDVAIAEESETEDPAARPFR